ncbi:asparaginase [Pseudohoeflea coraliihabitans]|uniref:Asparaginase n=1 Tax=Pseudohoeflea coraliihabitans TaxID=2860393 RepID=A0ABS6WMN8_9HYPH|nr:asparaginase [Pseudohoeflea sp. DP4N28-3]MBW3097237.1 asparaginase [Pseudohoeflea sp. DP4N28-3]
MADSKLRVAVIGCGGTISTEAATPLDFIDYPETGRKLEIDEVLAALPEAVHELAAYVPIPFRAVGSSAIGPGEWAALAGIIDELAAGATDLAGVVVVHGTATLEESAYFLHLTLNTDLPVAFVGAQRPLNTIGTDAVVNFAAAVRTVLSPEARGKGVMVVLNDEIHCARDVTKTSTYRLDAFRSVGWGPIGVVDADRVHFHRAPLRAHTAATPFRITADADLPRVDISYSYAGADATAASAFLEAGASGIVSAGFAPGMPTPLERRFLEQCAASGVAVVQSSRVGSGRVAPRCYLEDKHWIAADDLTPQKARILLMLALAAKHDLAAIRADFKLY